MRIQYGVTEVRCNEVRCNEFKIRKQYGVTGTARMYRPKTVDTLDPLQHPVFVRLVVVKPCFVNFNAILTLHLESMQTCGHAIKHLFPSLCE